MSEQHLSDGRTSRHDEGTTSASSHPELLCGYLAMRPRWPVRLTPSEQATTTVWSQCVVGTMVILAAAVILLPIFKGSVGPTSRAQAAEIGTGHACARWDERAGAAIAILAQQSQHDIELRQISDAVFRMRRARRNCQINWIALACHDYQAIIQGTPGTAMLTPSVPAVCELALDHSASR